MSTFSHSFLRLFLPLALLLIGGAGVYGSLQIKHDLRHLHDQESAYVRLGAAALSSKIEFITRDLVFLSRHSGQRDAINQPTPENLAHLGEDFSNFLRVKGIYDQIRWIDETGMEVVRVNYGQGKPVVVPPDKLQNKSKRYFFTETIRLNFGEVFISPLDLNFEHGEVEVPYKPMIRIATPVADQSGRKRGMVVLNYYGNALLNAFATTTADIGEHAMLTNAEGYWLKSPNPADEWGFMFKRPELSLAARAPAAWKTISSENSGQLTLDDGLWTWETVYPLLNSQSASASKAHAPTLEEMREQQYFWKSVSHYPADKLNAIQQAVWLKVASIAGLLLVLTGLFSWKLARSWALQAAAEEKYKTVADFTYDWEIWISPTGRYKYCSPSCVRVTGRSVDAFMANPDLLLEIAHPDDRALLETHRLRDKTSDKHCEFSFRIVLPDGQVRWLEHACQPVFGEKGKFLGRRASNRDITERKALEHKLVKIEALERIREITSQVPGVVFQFRMRPDGSCCVPFASEAVHEIYRLNPEEVREDASKAFALVHPDDLEHYLASIQASARDLTPWQHEYRLKFADGTERCLFSNALPQREEDGSTLWNGFTFDITERKKTEEELKIFFDLVPELLCVASSDGRFLKVNPMWQEVLGYSEQEILDTPFLDLIHPDDKDATLKAVEWQVAGNATMHFTPTATAARMAATDRRNGLGRQLLTASCCSPLHAT